MNLTNTYSPSLCRYYWLAGCVVLIIGLAAGWSYDRLFGVSELPIVVPVKTMPNLADYHAQLLTTLKQLDQLPLIDLDQVGFKNRRLLLVGRVQKLSQLAPLKAQGYQLASLQLKVSGYHYQFSRRLNTPKAGLKPLRGVTLKALMVLLVKWPATVRYQGDKLRVNVVGSFQHQLQCLAQLLAYKVKIQSLSWRVAKHQLLGVFEVTL